MLCCSLPIYSTRGTLINVLLLINQNDVENILFLFQHYSKQEIISLLNHKHTDQSGHDNKEKILNYCVLETHRLWSDRPIKA